MTYYAVCNVNGPISFRLDAETEDNAVAEFASIDDRELIGGQCLDAEYDLGIDGADMSEEEFAAALRAAGCAEVRDLSPVHNYHAGTTAHLANGWTLWSAPA